MKGALPILAAIAVAYVLLSQQQAQAAAAAALPGQTGRTIPAEDYEPSAGRTAGSPVDIWMSQA